MSTNGLDGSAGKIRTDEDLTSLPAKDFDVGDSALEEADESTGGANGVAVEVKVCTFVGVGESETVGVAVGWGV